MREAFYESEQEQGTPEGVRIAYCACLLAIGLVMAVSGSLYIAIPCLGFAGATLADVIQRRRALGSLARSPR